MVDSITPTDLYQKLDAGQDVDLIDVRTPLEFREIHTPFANNRPLDSLDPEAIMHARNGSRDQPLYVMCRTGKRATKACEKFIAKGYENVVNVDGGVNAWDQAGLPVLHGKKAISLERQVRIAAGLLVVVGSLLALFVNKWFGLLPAFVGGGLVFAGITDTCGMGMMLAKMPWNQVHCTVDSGKANQQGSCCS